VIADLHLDVLCDVAERRAAGDADPFAQRHLPSLRAAGVRVQVLPAFVADAQVPELALRATISQLELARREAERSQGALRIVQSRAELAEALDEGAIAGVLALEGVDALGRDPAMIRPLHRLGVRMAGLTWNRSNAFADGLSDETGAGLTPRGRALLDEMAELGMALDLSHLSPRGCALALEHFDGTVLASHANAGAVHANPRNLEDDVLAAIGERGGVVGLCATPAFTGPGDPAVQLTRHRDHIASLAGQAAVAFGADFCDFFGPDVAPLLPEDPDDVDRALAAQPEPDRATFYRDVLAAAGETEDGPLAWGNAMAVLERVL
jgi:membrane dipeptidase